MSYIFKKDEDCSILLEMVWNILEKYAIKNNNYYHMNYEIFKKIRIVSKDIQSLFQMCHYYYKPCVKYYLEREITYKNFMIIVKHICREFEIPVEKKNIYQHNLVLIDYFIYLAPE